MSNLISIEGTPITGSAAVVPAHHLSGLTLPEREAAVTNLIMQAAVSIRQAVEAGEPADVLASYKNRAAAITDLSKRVDVSKDVVLDAQVVQRASERALGGAIRMGQQDGSIRSHGKGAGGLHVQGVHGKVAESTVAAPTTVERAASPYDFATNAELYGDRRGVASNGIYALADNGTDEEFEEALHEARAEGNVSRANVVRKVKDKADERSGSFRSPGEWDAIANDAKAFRLLDDAHRVLAADSSLEHFRRNVTSRGVKFKDPRSVAKTAAKANGIVERMGENILGHVETAIGALDVAALDLVDPETAARTLEQLDTAAKAIRNTLIKKLNGITR